jgi:hypothetical protein
MTNGISVNPAGSEGVLYFCLDCLPVTEPNPQQIHLAGPVGGWLEKQ